MCAGENRRCVRLQVAPPAVHCEQVVERLGCKRRGQLLGAYRRREGSARGGAAGWLDGGGVPVRNRELDYNWEELRVYLDAGCDGRSTT